jgi:hypothetical protein
MGLVNRIRMAVSAALIAATLGLQPATSLAAGDQGRGRGHRVEERRDRYQDRRDRDRAYYSEWRNYDHRNYEPGQGRYDAARYYRRDDGRYGVRRLGRNDRIYRGYDDQYYCRRDDGTTGLIVGAIAGGVLGHIIAPGGSKTLGTVIGAGGGALLGREIDRGDITCR